jgi:phytol kinase
LNGIAGVAIAASVIALLAALRFLQKRYRIGAELSRKLFHIAGGIVSLLLPFIFSSLAAVVLATACITVILLAVRLLPGLRGSVGLVLNSVNRPSLGELCFPLSVLMLYALAHNHIVYYAIPLLILTFADSMAALIGTRYGRVRYAATDGSKSLEGSAAFFLVGFLGAHVPLLLWTDIGREESLLVAVILAFLLVILEAVCWAGLDNLFVPLCAYAVMRQLVALPAADLLVRLAIMVGALAVILLWGKRTTLNLSGVLGGFLLCYAVWMLADWRWVAIPLIVFVAHPFLAPRPEFSRYRIHDVHTALSIFSAGLFWVLAGYILHRDFFYPYALAFAAHLAIISAVRRGSRSPGHSKPLLESLLAWAVIFAAFVTLRGGGKPDMIRAVLALPCVCAATLLYGKLANQENRWEWEATAAGLASLPAALW